MISSLSFFFYLLLRDGTVFENSLESLAKEIVNALDSVPESAIKLNDSEMPAEASAAPVRKVNIQKKPGRAFIHKLTGKFLAESGTETCDVICSLKFWIHVGYRWISPKILLGIITTGKLCSQSSSIGLILVREMKEGKPFEMWCTLVGSKQNSSTMYEIFAHFLLECSCCPVPFSRPSEVPPSERQPQYGGDARPSRGHELLGWRERTQKRDTFLQELCNQRILRYGNYFSA